MTKINLNIILTAKPCPFCGKDPQFYFSPSFFQKIMVYIGCPNKCASKYQTIQGHYLPIEEIGGVCNRLFETWNTRAKE